jgi:hypothetical protein
MSGFGVGIGIGVDPVAQADSSGGGPPDGSELIDDNRVDGEWIDDNRVDFAILED